MEDFVYDPDDPQFEGRTRRPLQQVVKGEGAYGITIVPPFPCINGKTYPNHLGKVFLRKYDADLEWGYAERVKMLKKGPFAFPTEQCWVHIPTSGGTPVEQEIQKFYTQNMPPDDNVINEPLIQHVMPYYGLNLSEYMNQYYYSKQISRTELVVLLESLFQGSHILISNGIVHQDLKETNLVVSNKKGLRIIDFGYTHNLQEYYSNYNRMFQINYTGVSPPETMLFRKYNINYPGYDCDYDTFKKDFTAASKFDFSYCKKQTEDFINQYKELLLKITKNMVKLRIITNRIKKPEDIHTFCSDFLGYMSSKERFDSDFTEMFTEQWGIDTNGLRYLYNYVINAIFDYYRGYGFANKHDTFSIGMLIYRITQGRFLLPEKDDNPEAVKLFNQLMQGLLHLSPVFRYDTAQAISLVKRIKKIPHDNPFEVNKDSSEVRNIFLAFGKRSLKQVMREINYLKC